MNIRKKGLLPWSLSEAFDKHKQLKTHANLKNNKI